MSVMSMDIILFGFWWIGASPKNFPKILPVDAVRAELLKFNGAKPSHTFS